MAKIPKLQNVGICSLHIFAKHTLCIKCIIYDQTESNAAVTG